jgi:hypothetical protein
VASQAFLGRLYPPQTRWSNTMQLGNKSEQLAMRILEGARDRAMLHDKGPVMVLRTSRFVEILKTAPQLISYDLDYHASVPGWPRYVAKFEDCFIELSEQALA